MLPFNQNACREKLAAIDPNLVNKVLQDPAFKAIFTNFHIPVDPKRTDKTDIHELVQSAAEREKLARLAIFMAQEKPENEEFQILTDYDGTQTSFVNDPAESAIDPDCYNGLTRIKAKGMMVAYVTGRTPEEMAPMATPQQEVRFDDRGNLVSKKPIGDIVSATGDVVLPAGNQRLLVPIMASHGTILQMPDNADGTRPTPRKMELTEAEVEFIRLSHELGRKLEAQFPGIGIQYKETNGINADAGKLPPGQQAAAIKESRRLLKQLIDDPSKNPVIGGKPAFEMADESGFETCARNTRFTKAYAITEHGLVDTNRPTIFMCDSLGEQGTDGSAAIRINRDFPLGFVLHVRNDRKECLPIPGSGQEPFASFASPNQLGRFLQLAATLKETRFMCLDSTPKHAPEAATPKRPGHDAHPV